jgi:hypothetical protein
MTVQNSCEYLFEDLKFKLDKGVNLSTPRPESRGLLEVHPEPGLSTPPSKAELHVAERVN